MPRSTHLNPKEINWDDMPDSIFKYKGKKSDVSGRLRVYLTTLIANGMGLKATSSFAGISYDTIVKHRKANKQFAEYEEAAQEHNKGEVHFATFQNAKDRKSKNQVPAAKFYLQSVHGWKDPIHSDAEMREHIQFSIETWTKKDQAHARQFLRNVDKYAQREQDEMDG